MSVVATGTDFAVFYGLLGLSIPSHLAAGAGCTVGAFVGFALGYRWAFEPSIGIARSAIRYVCVSAASAAAVVGGMALCAYWAPRSPNWSWLLVRVAVYLAVTFPLFRYWAFESKETRAVVSADPKNDPLPSEFRG